MGDRYTIHEGDCRTVLATLPAQSVQCCVTSPPYWGLRDYGCDCQIGLEETPEQYVAELVAVFREVRRVLRDDGVLWLNLGDSYAATGKSGGGDQGKRWAEHGAHTEGPRGGKWSPAPPGLKPKDLVGIPWRVAFALQADGWYLRSDVIWAKPNPMPESVNGWRWEQHMIGTKDERRPCPGCDKCAPSAGLVLRRGSGRPTKAHEYVFLLSKSARYYYDADAVREGSAVYVRKGTKGGHKLTKQDGYKGIADGFARDITTVGRNKRTVWTIATQPYPGAHFAVMPQKLAETCVLAGCPREACAKCGAPVVRVVERRSPPDSGASIGGDPTRNDGGHRERDDGGAGGNRLAVRREPTGAFRPSCDCDAGTVPGVVLDPFCGAATTGLAALKHGRRFVGVEGSAEYIALAEERLGAPQQTALGVE